MNSNFWPRRFHPLGEGTTSNPCTLYLIPDKGLSAAPRGLLNGRLLFTEASGRPQRGRTQHRPVVSAAALRQDKGKGRIRTFPKAMLTGPPGGRPAGRRQRQAAWFKPPTSEETQAHTGLSEEAGRKGHARARVTALWRHRLLLPGGALHSGNRHPGWAAPSVRPNPHDARHLVYSGRWGAVSG